jgi:hypothetical protein
MRRTCRLAGLVLATASAALMAGRAEAQAGPPRGAAGPDTSGALIPAGFGTLHQDDIAVALNLEGIVVKLIPLDESVIRVLAPDSYRSLHDLRVSRASQLARGAALNNLHEFNVWLVEFNALVNDAAFTPGDLTISGPGRDFHPVQVIPVTRGFGQNRLLVRQPQSALYLFEDGMALDQPLTVTMGTVTSTDWQAIQRRIDTERTQVRARAARTGRGAPPPTEPPA